LLIDPDDLKAELAAIEAESIGWLSLGEGLTCKFIGYHCNAPSFLLEDEFCVL